LPIFDCRFEKPNRLNNASSIDNRQ
jgi:hypothetical protein